ncbi:FAD/NAD(P)-binding domain-containing protein [Aspergillus costaricaensis CBS 115574]|uniref:FAD/NAD(P)-binding domain-containing protein n=1 Tax=Aspergillus costaricaensis CBS 115574 TaxID=1448317 RepID=A0ACD1IS81_9EURO|nr:FAD/NAD(P)-binding domain-containing protein [Aspergillus costaricaensis CBS 115574]RAK93183.1 FAD/NAD(P)-binding domain-containing protein [Aspergillus costaricaensis CBS 115574]
MTFTPGVGPDGTAPPNSSDVHVIIVGLGVAGLTAAIECYRKGHRVTLLERSPVVKGVEGDGITIGANGSRVTAKWGDGAVHERMLPFRFIIEKIKVIEYTGYDLGEFELRGYNRGDGYTLNRGTLVTVMYEHARELGIDIRLNSPVTDYWETDHEAGVVVHGERIAADCVLCAEGVHSKGREKITGEKIVSWETGWSAFRGCLNTDAVAADPATRWALDNAEEYDQTVGWVSDDIHFALWRGRKGKELFWYCTHENEYAAEEGWDGSTDVVENVLDTIKDWPVRPQLEPLIRKGKGGWYVDQKLVTREPMQTWLSPRRRMMVIGDASHAALPSSGQGASQAIEDGAVLAIALELSGKQDVPLALSVGMAIRHARASVIQRGAPLVLKSMMKTTCRDLRKDLSGVTPPHPSWIFDHDCQEYTYREFAKAANSILTGQPYQPTNVPADGVYRLEYNSRTVNGQP